MHRRAAPYTCTETLNKSGLHALSHLNPQIYSCTLTQAQTCAASKGELVHHPPHLPGNNQYSHCSVYLFSEPPYQTKGHHMILRWMCSSQTGPTEQQTREGDEKPQRQRWLDWGCAKVDWQKIRDCKGRSALRRENARKSPELSQICAEPLKDSKKGKRPPPPRQDSASGLY